MRTIKFILLPILGIIAAVIAFRMAAPFEDTLNRPYLGEEDARALFTWGTKWGEVNRIAFGALLCGPFAVVLSLGRRSGLHVLFAGIIGTVLGGFVNFITDSGADLIGIAINTKRGGAGPIVAMFAWCVLVPLGIAFTLVVAQGITRQRIHRAKVALKYAIGASIAVQLCGGMLASQDAGGDVINLQSQVPVWRMVEIAVGLAFGLTILVADEYIRAGTIRLMHGKNEFVDWSLDHAVSQIGSAEGCEIYIRGFKGVEPVHAAIVRQGDRFVLDPKAPTRVNGVIVGQTTLNSTDEITIGDAKLIFTSNAAYAYAAGPPTPIYLGNAPHPKVLQDAFGRQVPLSPGRYGAGSAMSNPICLHFDPQVSPTHAEIIVTDISITVIDLQSTIGTRINGVAITAPTSLHPGDTLEIGSTRFTFLRS